MSRVQLALNVSDLDEAITFYSKLFATEPAKVRPGYANFAIVEPPLKLVLIEGNGDPGFAEPPRRRGRVDRRGRGHGGAPEGRRPGHRDRGRRGVLLRGAGQGVGRRSRRDARGRSTPCSPTWRWCPASCAPSSPTPTPCVAPDAARVGRSLLLIRRGDREHRPRAPRDGRGDRHRAAGRRRRRLRHLRATPLA